MVDKAAGCAEEGNGNCAPFRVHSVTSTSGVGGGEFCGGERRVRGFSRRWTRDALCGFLAFPSISILLY